jgi:hypothetical protein
MGIAAWLTLLSPCPFTFKRAVSSPPFTDASSPILLRFLGSDVRSPSALVRVFRFGMRTISLLFAADALVTRPVAEGGGGDAIVNLQTPRGQSNAMSGEELEESWRKGRSKKCPLLLL